MKRVTEIVYANKLEFPTVSICSYNKYKKSALEANTALAAIVNDLTDVNGDAVEFSDPNMAVYKNATMYDISTMAAPTLEDTFRMCKWRGVEFNCSEAFETTTSELSVCFSFISRAPDGGEILTVSSTGEMESMMVQLDLMQDEYYESDVSGAGFKVSVEILVPCSPPQKKK